MVIKCGIEDRGNADGAPDSMLRREMSLFDKPTRGTSMDEFKEMLHGFLKVRHDKWINCHHSNQKLFNPKPKSQSLYSSLTSTQNFTVRMS